jgi:hypothetical protein
MVFFPLGFACCVTAGATATMSAMAIARLVESIGKVIVRMVGSPAFEWSLRPLWR